MKTTWCVLACSMFLGAGLAAPLAAQPPADEGKLKAPLKKSKPTEATGGPAQVGSVAPDWTLKDPAGKEHKLSDYKGQVVVMDFWGTWCGPCKAASPKISELNDKYAKTGKVKVFGLNYGDPDSAKPIAYMKEHKYTHGLLLKAEPAAAKYKVESFPTFIVVGPDGKIVHRSAGLSPSLSEDLSKAIDSVIDKATAEKPKDKKPAPAKPEGDKKPEEKPADKPSDKPADAPKPKPN